MAPFTTQHLAVPLEHSQFYDQLQHSSCDSKASSVVQVLSMQNTRFTLLYQIVVAHSTEDSSHSCTIVARHLPYLKLPGVKNHNPLHLVLKTKLAYCALLPLSLPTCGIQAAQRYSLIALCIIIRQAGTAEA